MKKQQILALVLALVLTLAGCAPAGSSEPAPASIPVPESSSLPEVTPDEGTLPPKSEYRAMWVSYLEWEAFDFSSEAAFAAGANTMMQNCADLGLNTVIAQVRPFADALYPSEYFPWSHLCTGTQGGDPGFDPLAILIQAAHDHGLELEAWLNPYRVRLTENRPALLALDNLANLRPDWVKAVEQGLYLDPSNKDVQQYIVNGVMEIVYKYDVDGIHFDDYFYPTTDPSFDAQEYAANGGGLALDEWRRGNVNSLVQAVYSAIKAEEPTIRFGISPQGNMDNNYNGQYSDVALWMSTPGYLDYVLPQLYWGYGYTTQSGSTRYGYENVGAQWAALPRAASVELYFGLGAYRIGIGDGGAYAEAQSQWQTGENLAKMIRDGRAMGTDGYVLYRYDNLFNNAEYGELAQAECSAILQCNAEQ